MPLTDKWDALIQRYCLTGHTNLSQLLTDECEQRGGRDEGKKEGGWGTEVVTAG